MSQFTKQNSLQIVPIPAFKDNYIWAIHALDNKELILIDPGDAKPCLDYIKHHQLMLSTILITHHHPDHVGGISELKSRFPEVSIFGPDETSTKGAENIVQHNDTLTFESLALRFEVSHIPGHTLGHVAYYCKDQDLLFCGDTLFSGGCGRLFEGSPEQMHSSLSSLATLPSQTKVFCTHEYTLANLNFALTVEPSNVELVNYYNQVKNLREHGLATLPSTIGLERAINPFLRCNEPEVIESAQCFSNSSKKDTVDVFATIRQWKDNF